MKELLCYDEEQSAVSAFFEKVAFLLKDCDECEEKDKIKEIIHDINNNVSYIFVGESGVGKTTLIQSIFGNIFEVNQNVVADICEYRYGENKFITQPINGFGKIFIPAEKLKGISVIDTKDVQCLRKETSEKLAQILSKSGVIFVVLDAQKINSPRIWDVIENFSEKNMVFFLTKCDLLKSKEIENCLDKLKIYMREAGISAPIFPVSCVSNRVVGTVPLEEVCSFVQKQIIGETPFLSKQGRNIEETSILLNQMKESYFLRKKQFESDIQILNKISVGLDEYVINQEKIVNNLIDKVTEEICKDIDEYQNEIISKMDPFKIKERFRCREDFVSYLNLVNANYQKIMSDAVTAKTTSAIKGCLHELELVFEDAVGFFNQREDILAISDKFYGSLSVGRKQMLDDTKENTVAICDCYKTLCEASETLFLQIWNERDRYDKKKALERGLSIGGGGTVGAVGGAFLAKSLIGATTTGATGLGAAIGTVAGVFTTVGLVTIGVIIGAATIHAIAKALYEPKADAHLEEVTQKCIAQFKNEVSQTREVMIIQVSEQIKEIFKKEIATVDGCFAQFRISVNSEEKTLPLLEMNLEHTQELLSKINAL